MPPWQRLQSNRAAAVSIPSAAAVARPPAVPPSSRCGAVPKLSPQRAAAVPVSSDRKRVRFVPSLELFVVAGMWPGDFNRQSPLMEIAD